MRQATSVHFCTIGINKITGRIFFFRVVSVTGYMARHPKELFPVSHFMKGTQADLASCGNSPPAAPCRPIFESPARPSPQISPNMRFRSINAQILTRHAPKMSERQASIEKQNSSIKKTRPTAHKITFQGMQWSRGAQPPACGDSGWRNPFRKN